MPELSPWPLTDGQPMVSANMSDQRLDRFTQLLQLTQKVHALFQTSEDRLVRVQHFCSMLVEEGPWPQAWVVLLDEKRFPEHALQAGIARPAAELLDQRRGGWPYCLLRASHRENIFTITDPSFSCGACPRIAVCQPYGHWVFGLEYHEQIIGILVVGIPRNRLAHAEEKNALLLLADALAEALHTPPAAEPAAVSTGKIFHPQQFRLFQSAVDSSGVRIVLKDKQNLIRWCNQPFAQAFDKNPIELVGKTLKDLFPYSSLEHLQHDAQENTALFKDLTPQRRIHNQHFPKPDTTRWFLTEKNVYFTPDQRPAGIVEVSFEITSWLNPINGMQPRLQLITSELQGFPMPPSPAEGLPTFPPAEDKTLPEYLN